MFNKLFKIVIIAVFLFTSSSFARPVDEIYGGVSDGQLIYYSHFTNKWYYQRPHHWKKSILEVTRYVSDGSGSYTEYVSPQGQVYTPAGSNYEFLYKGRLITYHIFDAKFFEIVYHKRNKAFVEIPLETKEIKHILGNPKVILISAFDENNEIIVRKIPLKTQWFVILNDTDKYFYRYSLDTADKDGTIKTLFFVKQPADIKFSHYIEDRDEFPAYKIKVRNGF